MFRLIKQTIQKQFKSVKESKNKGRGRFLYIIVGGIFLLYFIINALYKQFFGKENLNFGSENTIQFNVSYVDVGLIAVVVVVLVIVKIVKKLSDRKEK